MRLGTLALLALFTGPMAYADTACEDLWFSRNVIYDAHGYCFGSPLGKAMFDNTGCTTVDPELSPELAKRVAQNWARYNAMECNVDQSQAEIAIYNRETRAQIMAQPIAAEFGDLCQTFGGPETALMNAPADSAEKLGAINVGDMLGLLHEPENDWHFITVLNSQTGKPVSGWTSTRPTQCGS